MKLRHAMTAALGALVLSCQGPAAVLAQDAATGAKAAANPDPAITGPVRPALAEALKLTG